MVNTMGILSKISLELMDKLINHKVSIMVIIIHTNRIINIISKKMLQSNKIIKNNFKICKKIRIKKGNIKKMMKGARVTMLTMKMTKRKLMVKRMKMTNKMKAGNQNPIKIMKEVMRIKKTMKNQIQKTIMTKIVKRKI